METIKIACEGAGLLSVDEMVEFQGELKSLSKKNYERLRAEILDTGVGFPIRIWRHEGKAYVIGGHQTRRTLIRMRDEEKYDVPRIPVSFVEARDYMEAKRRVLQDISQYGQIERQGLYEFLHEAEMDVKLIEDKFDLPNLDLESFKYEFFKDVEPEEGPAIDDLPEAETKEQVVDRLSRDEDENPLQQDKETYLNSNIKQVVLFYEGPQFEDVITRANAMLERFGLDNFSTLFIKLIENEEQKYARNGSDLETDRPEEFDSESTAGDRHE